MSPKELGALDSLRDWLFPAARFLHRTQRELSIFPDLQNRCDELERMMKSMLNELERLLDEPLSENVNSDSLTGVEIDRLLGLNDQLRRLEKFLCITAQDVAPRLDAKLADPQDPMFDYEIEAKIDYALREGDPEYDEDDDNYLTSREESLKHPSSIPCEINFAESGFSPTTLLAKPHCWMFHDLYDHSYRMTHRKLGFRDCLRIGKIFIDVQIWQQYQIDVQTGKWVKSWQDDGQAVFVAGP